MVNQSLPISRRGHFFVAVTGPVMVRAVWIRGGLVLSFLLHAPCYFSCHFHDPCVVHGLGFLGHFLIKEGALKSRQLARCWRITLLRRVRHVRVSARGGVGIERLPLGNGGCC